MPRNDGTPKPIFEGQTIKVGIKARGKAEGKAKNATFMFYQGLSLDPVATVEVDVKKHALSANEFKTTFVVPDVPEGEDYYLLSCRYKIGDGEEHDLVSYWGVFRDNVRFVAKREVDGQLTEAGPVYFHLEQNGSKVPVRIPHNGRALIALPEPAPFTLKFEEPFRFVEYLDGKDKGPERVFKWQHTPYVARILGPSPPEGKVYVNLPGPSNEVALEVAAKTTVDTFAGAQDLWVKVEFKNETKRGKTPQRGADQDERYTSERTVTGLENIQQVPGDGTLTIKGTVKTGTNGKATVTLKLGRGGGETCKVEVGTAIEPDRVQATRTFTSWRKLFVQFAHTGHTDTMDLGNQKTQDALKSCYAAGFIEVDLLPPLQIPEFPIHRGAWLDGRDCGRTAGKRYLIVNGGGHGMTDIATRLTPADPGQAPLFICLIAVDEMFDMKVVTSTAFALLNTYEGRDVVMAEVYGSTASSDEGESWGRVPAGDMWRPRASFRVTKARRENNRYVRDDNGDTVKDVVLEGDVAPDRIIISSQPKDRRGTLRIILPDEAVALLRQPDHEADVTYDAVMKASGGTAGLSDGAHAVMVGASGLMLLAKKIGRMEYPNTYIHEIGHAIGMCGDTLQLSRVSWGNGRRVDDAGQHVDLLPDYTIGKVGPDDTGQWTYTEHGRAYQKRGHVGGHCASGGPQSEYDSWGSLEGKRDGAWSCAIFGESQILRIPVKYCARCTEMLKAMEIWVGEKAR